MRREHKKSRTGCTQCKRRRIKCDERAPSCLKCEKSKLDCSLEFLTPKRMSPLTCARLSMAKCHQTVSPKPTPALSAASFNSQTHELLYHYQSSVFLSLAGNRRQSIYKISIPQLGIEHPFLLSGIRAISALHLATAVPYRRQELQNIAVFHQSAALLGFRSSMRNPNITEAAHANFAFAGSAVYYVMGLPDGLNADRNTDRCRIPSKDDENPHWFLMMRGLMTLLATHWHILVEEPFAPLLDGHADPAYSENPDDERLAALEEMCLSPVREASPSTTPTPNSSPQHEHEVKLCQEALKELRISIALAHSKFTDTLCDKTAVHIWPGRLSQEFVELIFRRDPRALVLLAHYCVLLKKNDHVWCLKGIGSGLLDNIWRELGEEWRELIRWPMAEPLSYRVNLGG